MLKLETYGKNIFSIKQNYFVIGPDYKRGKKIATFFQTPDQK